MDYFPIFLKLHGQPVLVVGGGEIALRKTTLLLKAGAQVRIVAPELCNGLQTLVQSRQLAYAPRAFMENDLQGVALAIAATSDSAVNAKVSRLAQQRQCLVNVVDSPDLCSFVMPAIIDRSPLVVAVSSGGHAPVLARMLRARLESLIPQNYGRLAALAERFRREVKARILTMAGRRRFWEEVFEGEIGARVLAGDDLGLAEEKMCQALHLVDPQLGISPELVIIGVAAADPDLLSLQAVRLMQKADVVYAEPSVDAVILERCRRDAQLLRVDTVDWQQCLCDAAEGQRVIVLTSADLMTQWQQGEFSNLMQQCAVTILPAAPQVQASQRHGQGAGWHNIMRFDN